MELIEKVKWLLENDYLVVIDSTPILTAKFYDELKYVPPKEEIKVVKKINTTKDNKKDIWNKFIEDAEVPWRVKATDGGIYTVRQYNLPAVNKLIKILNDPEIDNEILVLSTKSYYKTVSYKLLLSKYLLNDVWLSEYKEWGKAKESSSSGENRFED